MTDNHLYWEKDTMHCFVFVFGCYLKKVKKKRRNKKKEKKNKQKHRT